LKVVGLGKEVNLSNVTN